MRDKVLVVRGQTSSTSVPSVPFVSYLKEVREKVDRWLHSYLPSEEVSPQTLHRAIHYSVFAGGKRLRPALALITCEAFGGQEEMVRPAACALEMIHTYSLIHDDLPCMDDDDLRRGRPSCHKAFDEATAVLAGDALLTSAFGVLTQISDKIVSGQVAGILAKASGSTGMVGGQIDDLQAVGRPTDLEVAKKIHRLKTGKLIAASVEIGAVCARVEEGKRPEIRAFGLNVGLAFQIVDDILDETSDVATLGKTPGKDAQARKMTYPACVGLERAKEEARILAERAKAMVSSLKPVRSDRLVDLTQFVINRIS